MDRTLVPKLRQLKVPTGRLILDPNNPRLITSPEDLVDAADFTDLNIQNQTTKRLCQTTAGGTESFRIREVEKSIRQSGWVPIDFIFVKKHADGQHYVVLEGNRRVAAIRNILADEETPAKLKQDLQSIEVMEIIDDLPPEELQRKITYLLGVRHHGSLVKWRKFARASNIFKRYLEVARMSWESFSWNEEMGGLVADALSIPRSEVRDSVRTYRAMKQTADWPQVRDSNGGVQDNHYSLFEEALKEKSSRLRQYLPMDPATFLIDEAALPRLDNLCHFSTDKKRTGAPIANPQEWRKFEKILGEEDVHERAKMLEAVETDLETPSVVWARRVAFLTTLQWDRWLLKVLSILKRVSLGDDLSSDSARQTAQALCALVDELDELDPRNR